MSLYSGPLAMLGDEAENMEAVDLDRLPEQCRGDWGHSAAVLATITAIVVGERVTLTRRRRTHGYSESPGVITGVVIGASHNHGGQMLLGIELDDGECVAVDVTEPRQWHWQVGG